MKYRFEIVRTDTFLEEICNFMKKVDLGMEGLGIKDIIIFNSKNDILITDLKLKLTEAYESIGQKVLHIEGGKIE